MKFEYHGYELDTDWLREAADGAKTTEEETRILEKMAELIEFPVTIQSPGSFPEIETIDDAMAPNWPLLLKIIGDQQAELEAWRENFQS